MAKTMPKAKAKTKKAKIKNRQKTPSVFWRWLKKIIFGLFVLFTFLLLSYLGYLDYTVRHQFEGRRRWALPAKVYASSVELYVDLEISASDIVLLLEQLRYRLDPRLAKVGTYFKSGNQISLYSRRFNFWDGQQEASKLKIQFTGNKIRKLTDLDTIAEVNIVRMEPVQIGSFYPSHKEDRILVKLDQVSDALIKGLLAIEDRDFYNHYGVSLKSILRALSANIRAGGIVQGGSTITQQLIKNYFLSSDQKWVRKFNEALMALVLEFRFDKDQILEAYINEIYLGQDGASSVHGFGLASQFYFAQSLNTLKLHQLATLVALVRGPSEYDPRRHPKHTQKRRDLVLNEMRKLDYITRQQADTAKAQKLAVIPYKIRSVNHYPAFIDLVKRRLREAYREQDLTSEGIRVFTTLDTLIQNTLETTITTQLQQLEKKPKTAALETAVVVTRREGGEIVALSGGRNKGSVGFNRALDALRPIGSLIKPVVYLTALSQPENYTVTTLIDDSKIRIEDNSGNIWTPKNYDGKEHGAVPLYKALAKSYNLATVRLGIDVGIARTVKTLKNLGIERPVNLYPSLLLGASELTPLDVTQMYQTLAGDGFVTPLRAIRAVVSLDNKLLQRYPYTVRQVVDPAATYLTNILLQTVMSEGTGRSAYNHLPKNFNLAGKTGTTNKLRDSWFAGYSGDYLSVAWIGRDDNKPMGLDGSSGALQLWTQVMKKISKQDVTLIPPDNIEQVWVEPETGLRADASCSGAKQFPFIIGSAPTQLASCLQRPFKTDRTWFERFIEGNF